MKTVTGKVTARSTRNFAKRSWDKFAAADDYIWVHDYHLMLLPETDSGETCLRPKSVSFLHIPFPSFELFRLLPWRRANTRRRFSARTCVGFHTYDYVTHFINSAARIAGFEHLDGGNQR